MIAGTVIGLSKLKNKSWDNVVGTLSQNPLLESIDGTTIRRDDKFVKEDTSLLEFDGSPDAPIVREVETWFHKLIAGEERRWLLLRYAMSIRNLFSA